ncbi:DoxX family protein [Salipiger abyssi]|uniref:DoxX-like family protein n=1 Tax=Salipiger abyssi TaxID=1250539 RepID=A0A1P8V120_9RHOB|nr:DoxX family protein [Salipiger abyssi]APZ55318.1 DoxX-like family protein [Salipiger abyssi]
MKKPTYGENLFAWLLAGFFVVGGTLNIFASPDIVADYQRWGYPPRFHYLTGALEWLAAVLIAAPMTRYVGSLLAGGIMISAAATVVLNGEHDHAIAPLIVLALVAVNAWVTRRRAQTKGFSPKG